MNLDFLVVLGSLVFMSLAVVIVLFVVMHQRRMFRYQLELRKAEEQKQEELLLASIQAEEDERNRIAMELHDDVAAMLAAAKLYVAKLELSLPGSEPAKRSTTLLDNCILQIRNISHKLQPSLLYYNGLQGALQGMADLLHSSGKLSVEYRAAANLPALPDQTALFIYRICQELTNNILKHSAASELNISDLADGDTIKVIILHDGEGLTQEEYEALIYKKGATGLKNIVNRLKLIRGSILFTKQGERHEIAITVPTK